MAVTGRSFRRPREDDDKPSVARRISSALWPKNKRFRGYLAPRPGSGRCRAATRWRRPSRSRTRLPDLPFLAELPGRGPGRRHDRPHGGAAGRHRGRRHPARLADRRSSRPRHAPREDDALVRPGCDGGGPRRLSGPPSSSSRARGRSPPTIEQPPLAEGRAGRPRPGQ